MQWFTADVLQLEEMRHVETDLMLVQAELDELEDREEEGVRGEQQGFFRPM